MNCIIPSLNVKVVARALQALSKIGDELFIEARTDKLTFLVLNLNKTQCVSYNFFDSFFSSYNANKNEFNDDRKEAVTLKIHMKVILPLFKGIHLEKKLDFVKIEHETSSDLITFKMKYKCDDIVMIHKLHLMEPQSLTLEIDEDSGSNNMCAPSSFYNQLLTVFSNSDDDITLEISKDKLVARNYLIGAPVRPKSVRSQVKLNASEFDRFKIQNETTINFSLKPLRTAIHFAEGFNLNVGFNFETGGRPMAIVMKNPTFEASFLVATLNPYGDAQSTLATTSIPTKITQVHVEGGHNLTAEDREALANENWDDFDVEMDNVQTTKSSKSASKTSNFQDLMQKAKQKKENVKSCDNTNEKKAFVLAEKDVTLDNNNDVIPNSPESPKTKRTKFFFGRCYDPTFHATMLGEILAENTDSE